MMWPWLAFVMLYLIVSGDLLAGRDAELRELHDAALRAAADRRGWVGLISGEPGIGKTRLAAECADVLARDGFGCAWVSCPEDGAAPPFWVWDQLLDQLGGGALRAEGADADPELARFLMFDAVAAGIRRAAAARPLLLVIDDVHWAEARPASGRLGAHRHLVRLLARAPRRLASLVPN